MDYRQFNNDIQNLMQKALAWDSLAPRANDAHKYCQKHLMPESWGKNVWHAILDDAIRMRKALEAKLESERKFPHSNTDMGS